MTELQLFSRWQDRRHCDLQEASSLEEHNRVLSGALPEGWAGCPQGWEWQLWLSWSSWTFSLGYLGKFCFYFNLASELCPLSPKLMKSWRWGCYILHLVHFHGVGGARFTSHSIVRVPYDWIPLELLTFKLSTLSLQQFLSCSLGFLILP